MSDPMTAKQEWRSYKKTLTRQLRHGIRKHEPVMTPALQTLGKLRGIWWVAERYDSQPPKTIEGRTGSQSEHALETSITSLGRAIYRNRRNSNRSMVSRLLRVPLDVLKSSAEGHQRDAVSALRQLDGHFRRCIKLWRQDRAEQQRRTEEGTRDLPSPLGSHPVILNCGAVDRSGSSRQGENRGREILESQDLSDEAIGV